MFPGQAWSTEGDTGVLIPKPGPVHRHPRFTLSGSPSTLLSLTLCPVGGKGVWLPRLACVHHRYTVSGPCTPNERDYSTSNTSAVSSSCQVPALPSWYGHADQSVWHSCIHLLFSWIYQAPVPGVQRRYGSLPHRMHFKSQRLLKVLPHPQTMLLSLEPASAMSPCFLWPPDRVRSSSVP